jgi:hypothetical protein
MKIFFAEVNPEEYTHAEMDSMFEDPDTGNHYFYMMETDEDGVIRLHDSCNRMVPFDFEQIEALCEATYALQELINMRATIEERIQNDVEEIINTTHQYTGVRILA